MAETGAVRRDDVREGVGRPIRASDGDVAVPSAPSRPSTAAPYPEHQHRYTRTGYGSGTSESTTVWGPWHCWCGAFLSDSPAGPA